MSNGTIKLRNKKFIKHLTKENRQIQFGPHNSGNHTNQEVSRLKAADTGREPERSERDRPFTRSQGRARHSV